MQETDNIIRFSEGFDESIDCSTGETLTEVPITLGEHVFRVNVWGKEKDNIYINNFQEGSDYGCYIADSVIALRKLADFLEQSLDILKTFTDVQVNQNK